MFVAGDVVVYSASDLAAAGGGSAAFGSLELTAEVVVLTSGVLATIESPEPQPVSVAATNASAPVSGATGHGSDFTPCTVPSRGPQVWQAWPRDHPLLVATRGS